MKNFKLITLTTAISICFFANTYSQTFCPPGATWYYNGDASFFSGYYKLTYVHDTTINSISCKMIIDHLKGYGTPTIDADIDTFYCYEQSGVVHMYNNKYGQNRFDTLYNINATVGSKWRMPRTDTVCDSSYVKVVATGIKTVNGYNLRYLSVEFNPFTGLTYTDTIIEKIGFTKTFFYYPIFCRYPYLDEGSVRKLRCYSDSIFGNYYTGISSSCDYYYTGVSLLNNDKKIQIFPTVTDSDINIKMDIPERLQGSFMLFDIAGRSILSKEVDTKILNIVNVGSINSGIYFYKIDIDNQYFKTGKLIITK